MSDYLRDLALRGAGLEPTRSRPDPDLPADLDVQELDMGQAPAPMWDEIAGAAGPASGSAPFPPRPEPAPRAPERDPAFPGPASPPRHDHGVRAASPSPPRSDAHAGAAESPSAPPLHSRLDSDRPVEPVRAPRGPSSEASLQHEGAPLDHGALPEPHSTAGAPGPDPEHRAGRPVEPRSTPAPSDRASPRANHPADLSEPESQLLAPRAAAPLPEAPSADPVLEDPSPLPGRTIARAAAPPRASMPELPDLPLQSVPASGSTVEISVHIGRIRIRQQAPEPTFEPGPRARPASGFKDMDLARRHVDRRWY